MIRYDGIAGSTYAGSWIGQIKGSNGTFNDITWFRLDAGTADTPWTELTIDTSTGYQNGNGYTTYYSIKNGIVYIQTTLGCTTPYNGGWKIVATGLPKPSIPINYKAPHDTGGSGFLSIQIDKNGNLKVNGGNSNGQHTISLSYPIF